MGNTQSNMTARGPTRLRAERGNAYEPIDRCKAGSIKEITGETKVWMGAAGKKADWTDAAFVPI